MPRHAKLTAAIAAEMEDVARRARAAALAEAMAAIQTLDAPDHGLVRRGRGEARKAIASLMHTPPSRGDAL